MAISKLKTKFSTGAWLPDLKQFFTKTNELIDNLNGVGKPGDGSYKVYTALLTQSGINNPVATVLENTLGNIVWTRTGLGRYNGTLIGAFISGKTVSPQFPAFSFEGNATFLPIASDPYIQLGWYGISSQSLDQINIAIYNLTAYAEWSSILENSKLLVEIRVYN